MSTPQESQEFVAQFLLRTLPSELLDTYITLTQLEYPISDKYSLTSQLGKRSEEKGNTNCKNSSSLNLINESLKVVDFPIQTPYSALEKFHARLFESFEPELKVDIPPDMSEQPSLAEVYRKAFGTRCSSVALEAYADAIRSDLNSYQALVIGQKAGEQCSHTWVPPLLPLPLHPPSPFSPFYRWRVFRGR
jgi:hypothetical protein